MFNLYADVDARSMTPSRNTRSYILRSVPSSPGRSFLYQTCTSPHPFDTVVTGMPKATESDCPHSPKRINRVAIFLMGRLPSSWSHFTPTDHIVQPCRREGAMLWAVSVSSYNVRWREFLSAAAAAAVHFVGRVTLVCVISTL